MYGFYFVSITQKKKLVNAEKMLSRIQKSWGWWIFIFITITAFSHSDKIYTVANINFFFDFLFNFFLFAVRFLCVYQIYFIDKITIIKIIIKFFVCFYYIFFLFFYTISSWFSLEKKEKLLLCYDQFDLWEKREIWC
jgi:hypothetical protein